MDGETEGERGLFDVLVVAAFAVDHEQVSGVAFEEHFEVEDSGVAAGEGGEDAALSGQNGERR